MIHLTSDAAIMFGLSLVSGFLCLALLVSWRTLRGGTHSLIWSCAFGIAAFQWAMIGGYNSFMEATDVAVIGATWSGAIVAILLMMGFRERAGLARRPWWMATAIVAAGLLVGIPYMMDYAQMALAIPQFARTLFLPLAILTMIGHNLRPNTAEIMASIVLLIFAGFSTVVGYMRLDDCGCETNTARVILLVGLPVLFSGLGIAIVQLLASDLAQRLRVAALLDPLTDALNRRGFEDAVTRLVARDRGRWAVVLIDLDHFKSVNDRFGHACGDEVLRGVADCIRRCQGDGDVFGRLGGDEFVLLVSLAPTNSGLEIAEQVRSAMRTMLPLPDGGQMTASFGVALLQTGDDLAATLRKADGSLYAAKSDGRDRAHLAADLDEPAISPALIAPV